MRPCQPSYWWPNLAYRKFIDQEERRKDDPITNTTPEDAVILEEMFVQIARTVSSDRRR